MGAHRYVQNAKWASVQPLLPNSHLCGTAIPNHVAVVSRSKQSVIGTRLLLVSAFATLSEMARRCAELSCQIQKNVKKTKPAQVKYLFFTDQFALIIIILIVVIIDWKSVIHTVNLSPVIWLTMHEDAGCTALLMLLFLIYLDTRVCRIVLTILGLCLLTFIRILLLSVLVNKWISRILFLRNPE